MNIHFTNIHGTEIEEPVLASKLIPEWYKDTPSYIYNDKKPLADNNTPSTIKRCMPVFDAITAGYIILSPADVYVSLREATYTNDETKEEIKKETFQHFQWSDYDLIKFHPVVQAPLHPLKNNHPYPKWSNPWAIKTPKGYSTLFVQPFHRESVFTIMPGIVDTDTYVAPVNFPFVMNDINFEGLIPKGTPIAQIIPFKRDEWTKTIGNESDLLEQALITRALNSKFFDRYKSMFWFNKKYK